MRIEARNFKAFSKNTLKGFVDIVLPDAGIVILQCSWHEKNGSEWISAPGKPFTDRNTGETRYANIVEWTGPDAKREFQEAAVKAIYRLLGSGEDRQERPRGDASPFI